MSLTVPVIICARIRGGAQFHLVSMETGVAELTREEREGVIILTTVVYEVFTELVKTNMASSAARSNQSRDTANHKPPSAHHYSTCRDSI